MNNSWKRVGKDEAPSKKMGQWDEHCGAHSKKTNQIFLLPDEQVSNSLMFSNGAKDDTSRQSVLHGEP